ncbi:MAG: GNAT family protein [Hyphomicrobiaceae bacterium]|nr:GNAT family protein [Hyphomicrobiaceae bacterium]
MIDTPRLRLVPVTPGDADRICALLWHPDVRRHLCDDALMPRSEIEAAIADSLDPSSLTAYWRLATESDEFAGMVGLQPPSTASLALRAIGWRSRELIVALEPRWWGRGLAREAVGAVATCAARDGVTFAIVACVDLANERSHRLMLRCGFQELGRSRGATAGVVVYEMAV